VAAKGRGKGGEEALLERESGFGRGCVPEQGCQKEESLKTYTQQSEEKECGAVAGQMREK